VYPASCILGKWLKSTPLTSASTGGSGTGGSTRQPKKQTMQISSEVTEKSVCLNEPNPMIVLL
jgi:hypothetical protein